MRNKLFIPFKKTKDHQNLCNDMTQGALQQ